MRKKARDIHTTFSPELSFLLACLRGWIAEKEQHTIETDMLDAVCIDGDLFLRLAVHHGVYPLVYQYLSASKNVTLPSGVVPALKQKCLENMSKSLHMTGEMVKVLQSMGREGIRVVVLKGFPLGDKFYGNVALRPFQDLDILVWPNDIHKAGRIVESHGYVRIYPDCAATPEFMRKWMKREHHFTYWHKDKQILLELHWRLGHHGMDLPMACVENSLTQVKIAGQLIYMLKTEELLLSLVLHGANHGWSHLKWLCDIGIILKRGEVSWEKLYGLAEHLGFKTPLNQALILARQFLAAAVPEDIDKTATKDRKAQILTGMVFPLITDPKIDLASNITFRAYYHQIKYGLSLQNGWRKKSAFIIDHFSPTERDIASISLPDQLYFMYYLVRLYNLSRQAVMNSMKK